MIKIFAEKFGTMGRLERQVNEFISEQKSVYPNMKFKTTLTSYETKGFVIATVEYDADSTFVSAHINDNNLISGDESE